MATLQFKNNASTTLSGSINNTQTSITVANGANFPVLSAGDYFYATMYETSGATEINIEIVKVTGTTGNIWTVVRAQDGTTGRSRDGITSCYVDLRLTAASAQLMLQKDNNLSDLASAPTARTNLGLGTMATQNANAVAITGGSISGVTISGIDSTTTISDDVDNTKKVAFQVSGVTTGTTRTLTVPNASGTIALTSDLTAGYQPLDSDLTAVAALAANGLVARTATGAFSVRSITQPAAGLTVTNGDGVAGNPTLALANDLAAVEAISGTGFVRRTAADTWSASAIVDGDLPSALTGKTYNALTLTANATGFALSGGTTSKTLTVSNSITLAGTDGTTITLPSFTGTVALNNQAFFIGTTSVAINRASAALSLTGVSIDGSAGSATTATTATKSTNLVGGNTTTLLGAMPYQSGVDATTLLAPNVTTGRRFLRMTGTGTNGAAPAWDTVTSADVGLGSVENTALSTWAGSANITTLGTVATGTWNATAISIAKGGTGQTTAVAAFDALSPATTLGDLIYHNGTDNVRLAGNITTTRRFIRQVGTGSVSAAPAWDTLQDADVPSALTGKTYNGLTLTAAGTGFTVAGGATSKTLTVSNTITLAGTDASTLNIGGGGTLGSAAFTASTEYAPAAGSSSIATVGTITAGTWTGGTIGISYGGTGATSKAAGFNALSPVTTLGDLVYGDGANSNTRLAGNTTTAKRFLTQTGTGSVSAAPGWNAIVDADVPSALTGKTYNGLSLTANATGFSMAGGTTSKTLTVSNNLTLSGTDGSTLNIGAGGTLGTAAFTASTAYEPAFVSLGVAKGGTGITSYTDGDLLYATAATTLTKLAKGTSLQVLAMNSGATAPVWATLDMAYLPDSAVKKSVRAATTADLGASTWSTNVLTGYSNSQTLALTTTAASTTISTTSTAGLKVGAVVSVATVQVAAGTTVATITNGTTFTVNNRANITTTAITGGGSVATATFAAQTYAPYAVGASITITGATPSTYNGTFTVTACTTTSVSWASVETVAATVQGTIAFTIAAGTSVSTSFAQTIAALTMDGITPALNDRILVKNQSTLGGIADASGSAKNGIYTVTTLGTASVPWVLTRATDADTITKLAGAIVNVDSGTANGGLRFDTDLKTTDTLNTTAVTWQRMLDYGIVGTSGATLGLLNTANTFEGANTFVHSTGQTFLASTTVTQDGIRITGRAGGTGAHRVNIVPAALTAARTLTLPDNTGTVLTTGAAVTAAQGGTGQTTYAVGDLLYASTTTALSRLADVATGNALISGGVGVAPSWGKIGLTTHISGTLGVANGGTGATTLTGLVKGNGTGAFTAAVAGTDFLAPAAIGVTVQAYDADLTSWAAIAPSAKQDALVSGTNIKSINSASVLGSGNIDLGGSVNGILKVNGSGVYSAAVAGTDYVTPSALSSYLTTATAASTYAPLASPTFTGTATTPNLAFNTVGGRITGDFSNGTLSSRVAFQSSTVNGNTTLTVLPNGTATISQVAVYSAADPTNTAFFAIQSNGVTNQIISNKNGTGSTLPVAVLVDGTERLRIATNGNVGVGVSAPTATLDVAAAAGTVKVSSTTTTNAAYTEYGSAAMSYIGVDGSSGPFLGIPNASFWWNTSSTPIVFGTASGERMRIDASGNVGIGKTPTERFEVYKASGFSLANVSVGGVGSGDVAGFQAVNSDVVAQFLASKFFSKAYFGTNSFHDFDLVTEGTPIVTVGANTSVLVKNSIGFGYGAGSGGTVTQATSKTTSVTLNKPTGKITMHNAALGAGFHVLFTLNNNTITVNDNVIVTVDSFSNYTAQCQRVASGGCVIRVTNISAFSASEAVTLNFAVIKGATS